MDTSIQLQEMTMDNRDEQIIGEWKKFVKISRDNTSPASIDNTRKQKILQYKEQHEIRTYAEAERELIERKGIRK